MISNEIMLTDTNFDQEVIKSELPVLVDFWAEWCYPCRIIAPVVEEIAKKYEGKLKVGKLDTDRNQMTAVRYGIAGIPTLMLFRNGELLDKMVGVLPKNMIEDKLKYYLSAN